MKIQSLRFTVFLLICLLIPLMATAQTVNIPDPNLRAKIETTLDKPAGATITEAEMATLPKLKESDANIRDLTGLEHATGLTSLDLRRNSISDISPLAELTLLTSVILYNNSISNISPLGKLTKLEELHLDNNSISDISPLARLTNMRWLLLQHNSISNLKPLERLTRMGTLNLAHNLVSDISALSGLTNLNLLVLTNNRVSDISALKGIRLLNAVVLTNNMVSDIEPLVANQGFRKIGGTDAFLYLRGNPLSDTSINTHVPTLRARGVIVDIGPTIKTLAKVSGDNQQGVINTPLVNPFVVEVQDENGSALSSGIEVTFSITRGGGTLSVTSTMIDPDGRASSTLTLGPGEGTNTVSVSAEGIQRNVIFTAEAVEVLPSPTTLLKISGDNQQGVTNTALANPFVIEVRDQNDSVLSGILVTFSVTAGGGTLSVTGTTTDADGRALSTLTLGSSVGTNTVSVFAAGIPGVETFTAEAQSSPPPPTATTLVKISGDNQQGVINTALGNPFVVEVRDQNGSVLSGIEVTFSVTTGGGTLGTTNTTTSVNGRALSTLTLGSSVGTNTVSVSAAGIQGAVTFTAEAQSSPPPPPPPSPPPPTATTLVKISGDGQQGVINTALGNPFVVEVRDQNDSVLSGIEVTFTVTAGGGTLGTTSTTTSVNGRASSILTLGSSVGTNTVSVSAAGIQGAVTFTAEAQSSPPPPTATTLVKISGDNQQGVINTALGNPFVVEVRDQNDSVLSGILVTFSVTAGGGTLGTTSTTTNTNGRASSTLTLGPSVGTNTVSVSAAGIQGGVTFTAEAQLSPPPPPPPSPPPPTATTLVKISGDGQQGVINTALGNPFVVEVRDQNDSVLSGIEVTFTVTAGGGTLGTTSTTTNTNGRASSTLTLGSSVGTNTVSVSAAGIQGAVTFTAEAQSSPPPPTATTLVKISGDNQQGVINTALGNPFVVEVRDQNDSVLSGIEVTFSVTAGGGTLSVPGTTTNVNGRAESTLTLGSGVGTHTVSVSAAGISEMVTFTAEGVVVVSIPDPNLRAKIETALGKVSGASITLREMATLTSLDGSNASISDLTGLEFAIGLTTLNLSGNSVTDLSPLVSNTGLGSGDTVDVRGNPLSYVSITTHIPALQSRGVTVYFDTRTATTLVKISGDNQQGVINTALANPFVVEVRDEDGDPFAGVTVTFTVPTGGGMLSTTSPITNVNGRAESQLTLGSSVGTNTVSVSVAGISQTVPFTAEAVAEPPPLPPPLPQPPPQPPQQTATTLVKISGDNQQGVINTALVNPFIVEVRDENNNPFLGGAVTFAVTAGGGTLSVPSTTTDADGRAKSTLTLGPGLSQNTVSVSAAGISEMVTFTAEGVVVVLIPDPNLRAKIETALGKVSGASITLREMATLTSLDGSNASISDLTGLEFAIGLTTLNLSGNSVTDLSPLVSNTGLGSGDTVDVRGNPLSYVSITTHIPALQSRGVTVYFDTRTATTLVKISGDNQQGVINTALANPFVVEVRDEDGDPFAGVTVTFTVPTGGGMLSTTGPTTNVNGRAESILTLGPSMGTNTVSVSAAGISQTVPFTAEAVAGQPPPQPTATTLVKISGDEQQGVINTALANPFVVEVRDENNSALSGILVTFSVTTGGGRLNPESTRTDASGRASSRLTLGSSVGTNTVSVSAAGIQEGVTFTAEAVTAPPSPPPPTATTLVKISGDNQQGVINTILGSSFVVEVRDESSDPLEGVAVTFSIIDGGEMLSAISTTTNANGRAESWLTLGSSVGTNTVSVSAAGIQEGVTFTAEAVAGPQPPSPPRDPPPSTATTLVKISGDNQQGVVNTILGSPFVVEVRDESSDPLEDVAVTFSIIAGGGTLSAISTTTNANGRAESTLTLGSSVGTNTVSVSATGIQEGVTFTAEAVADPQPTSPPPQPSQPTMTLVKISGDNQHGVVNTILGSPFVVEVRDKSSDPLEGVAVTFSIIAGGGTLSAISTMTDANGRAES